jgi:hypothetical protein
VYWKSIAYFHDIFYSHTVIDVIKEIKIIKWQQNKSHETHLIMVLLFFMAEDEVDSSTEQEISEGIWFVNGRSFVRILCGIVLPNWYFDYFGGELSFFYIDVIGVFDGPLHWRIFRGTG